jgi:hypothetical protein
MNLSPFVTLLHEFRKGVEEFNIMNLSPPFATLLNEFRKGVEEFNSSNSDKCKYSDWIIPESEIDDHFNSSSDCIEFRSKIYNDKRYIKWSNKYCEENNINPRKSKYANERVYTAGDSWWNWKVGTKSDTNSKDPEKHKYLDPSFHHIKKLYDTQKKKDEKVKK